MQNRLFTILTNWNQLAQCILGPQTESHTSRTNHPKNQYVIFRLLSYCLCRYMLHRQSWQTDLNWAAHIELKLRFWPTAIIINWIILNDVIHTCSICTVDCGKTYDRTITVVRLKMATDKWNLVHIHCVEYSLAKWRRYVLKKLSTQAIPLGCCLLLFMLICQ